MFRCWWLSLLILGIAMSVVLSHDNLPPGHSEDEHDEEPEDQGDEQHPDEDTETEDDEKDEKTDDEEDDDEGEEEDESQGDEGEDDSDQSHLEHDAFLGKLTNQVSISFKFRLSLTA